ncbi:Xpo1 [Symbiodinium natans]|uniref:Xpo1 protein n=1 Tax=Symbiodinium natans TaxID=878477 RepID=A0A812GXT4_9DINO|nr:Xpo1 [Symbiodinium natans]
MVGPCWTCRTGLRQPCGGWFLDLAAESQDGAGFPGFPATTGCFWNESVPEVSLQLRSGTLLTESCGDGSCSFQLALNVELTQPFREGTEVAQIAAICKGTENCSMHEGIEVLTLAVHAAGSTRRSLSSLSPGLKLVFEDLPRHSQVLELMEDHGAELPMNVSFSLQLPSGGLDFRPIANLSSLVFRIALFPPQSWNAESCEVTFASLTGDVACETQLFGLHRSLVLVDMSATAPDSLDPSRDLWDPGIWHLALPTPRSAFFPSRAVAELQVSGEDENASYVEFSGFFPFAALWRFRSQEPGPRWPRPVPAQLLVFGRSGYGPSPFPSRNNEVLVRLVLPATVSRSTRGGAGLSLLLPQDYECLSAVTLLGLDTFQDQVLMAPEALELSNDLAVLFSSLQARPDSQDLWRQRGTRPSECFQDLEQWEAFYAGQQIFLQVILGRRFATQQLRVQQSAGLSDHALKFAPGAC